MVGAPLTAEEDDIAIAPAPEADAFAHPHASEPAPDRIQAVRKFAAKSAAKSKTTEFKQTVIPIMLTVGALAFLTGAVEFVVPEDSPLYRPTPWAPYALIGLSAVFFFIATLNMLMVAAELLAQAEKAAKS